MIMGGNRSVVMAARVDKTGGVHGMPVWRPTYEAKTDWEDEQFNLFCPVATKDRKDILQWRRCFTCGAWTVDEPHNPTCTLLGPRVVPTTEFLA